MFFRDREHCLNCISQAEQGGIIQSCRFCHAAYGQQQILDIAVFLIHLKSSNVFALFTGGMMQVFSIPGCIRKNVQKTLCEPQSGYRDFAILAILVGVCLRVFFLASRRFFGFRCILLMVNVVWRCSRF
ncbi:Uncharacterised protein [Escherichia coli]|nr:Uncharacterised protein [Escherichia coli]CAD5649780.1 Uncharacterised protein [Escherichia coli]SQZ61258.1 Uncharacterised protein [Escherichia coli]SRY96451.1 Uncharacterised protein [Escherichia coli]